MQIPQSPQVIPVVPNRREAGPQCTATACNSRVAPSEIHSIRLSKKRALKAEPISLRALNTLKTWNRDECRERQRQGAVLWAGLQGVVQDRQGSCHHRQAANNDAGHPRQRKDGIGSPTRRLVHDAWTGSVEGQRHRRWPVHDDRDPEDLQGREWLGQADQRRKEDREDCAHGRGQLKTHELQDVVVQRAPMLDRTNDTGKLSSVRIIVSASLATAVPPIPIATPMSACFSAGASLTPSPDGHR